MTGGTSETVESTTSVVAAEAGGAESARRLELPPSAEAGSPSVEEGVIARHRDLASKLLFGPAAQDQRAIVLAVTSAASGEGVTTSAAATAVALAQSTTRSILLVDANLRRPALHALFGIPERPGLSQVLQEREARKAQSAAASADPTAARIQQAIHPTALPNLWVSPAGGTVPDPTRRLTSERAALVLELLSARFDFVVLDCPPVLASVDAGALCRRATHVALVVMAGQTPREHVRKACEHLQETPLIGVLLNGVTAP